MHRRVVAAGLGEHRLRGRRMRPGTPPGQQLGGHVAAVATRSSATSHAPRPAATWAARALATPAPSRTPASRTSETASAPFVAAASQSPSRYCASPRWPRTMIRPWTDIGGAPSRPTEPRVAAACAGVVGPQREDPRQCAGPRPPRPGRARPVGAPAPVRRRRGGPARPGRGLHEPRERGDLRPGDGRQAPASSARRRPRRRPRSATPARGGRWRRHARPGSLVRGVQRSRQRLAGHVGTVRSAPPAGRGRGRVRGWRGPARRSGSARSARASSPPASIAPTARTAARPGPPVSPLRSAAAVSRSAACRQSRRDRSSARPSAVSSAARCGVRADRGGDPVVHARRCRRAARRRPGADRADGPGGRSA